MRIIDETGKSKGPYISIIDAKYIDEYRILITFNDGTSRLVDFGNYLRHARHPDMRKYLDLKNFKKFKIVYGDIEWPNMDIAFPIIELYRGTIEFKSSKQGLFAESPSEAIESTRGQLNLRGRTLHTLKNRANKERVPIGRLAQRYIEEGMKRQPARRP